MPEPLLWTLRWLLFLGPFAAAVYLGAKIDPRSTHARRLPLRLSLRVGADLCDARAGDRNGVVPLRRKSPHGGMHRHVNEFKGDSVSAAQPKPARAADSLIQTVSAIPPNSSAMVFYLAGSVGLRKFADKRLARFLEDGVSGNAFDVAKLHGNMGWVRSRAWIWLFSSTWKACGCGEVAGRRVGTGNGDGRCFW